MTTSTTPDEAATADADGPLRPPAALQSSFGAKVFGALEEMRWLETLSEWIAGTLTPVTNRRALMDLLHGRWLGHALHPAISDLPLGLWSSVVVLDLIDDERGAIALTAGGCVAAVATAATGTADWTVSHGRERRLGLIHGLANSAGLALQLGALGARLGGRVRAGRVLSVVGLGVGTAAAFVGGELVFGRGLMVDHTAWTAGPAEWTAVLGGEELAGGATRAVDLEGRKVLLARVNGVVHAMEDTCSHAGGPLSEGTVEDCTVTCPWHGSRFRLTDGAVLGGPATFPQPRLEAREIGGRIEVRGREA